MLSSTSHSSSPPDADRLIGQLLDSRLRVLRCIGRGGMGTVYVAEHIGLGKQVAVKVLNATYAGQADVMARLHSEARNASAIASEHIVDVFDIGLTESGQPYVVMELLHGESLAERLRRCTALSELDTLHIGRQLTSALAAAHRSGIVHRDIKPENIFLCHRDGRDFVKLLDFGISKAIGPLSDLEPETGDEAVGGDGAAGSDRASPAADRTTDLQRTEENSTERRASFRDRSTPSAELLHRLTRTGAILGTPLYMSPEQARGERLDSRCDIYSLGVVLYECLTGSVPFLSTSYFGVIAKILTERPEPPSVRIPDRALSVALEQIVLCAMAADRSERYQTMDALLSDLDRYQRGEPILAWTSTRGSGRSGGRTGARSGGQSADRSGAWTDANDDRDSSTGWRRLLQVVGGSRRDRGPLPMLLPLLAGTLVVLLLGGLLVFWRGPQTSPASPAGPDPSGLGATAARGPAGALPTASAPRSDRPGPTRSVDPAHSFAPFPASASAPATSPAAAPQDSTPPDPNKGRAGATSSMPATGAAPAASSANQLVAAPAASSGNRLVAAPAPSQAASVSPRAPGRSSGPPAPSLPPPGPWSGRPLTPRGRPSPTAGARTATPALPANPLPTPLGDEQAPNPFVPHAP